MLSRLLVNLTRQSPKNKISALSAERSGLSKFPKYGFNPMSALLFHSLSSEYSNTISLKFLNKWCTFEYIVYFWNSIDSIRYVAELLAKIKRIFFFIRKKHSISTSNIQFETFLLTIVFAIINI